MKFLRQLKALYKVYRSPEYGGMLYDYANGQWNQIHVWETDEGMEEAANIVNSMVRGRKDEIYVIAIRCGCGRGYMLVESTGRRLPYIRAFWDDTYTPVEAILDATKKCRAIADKMGFRRPDDTIGRAS